MPKNMASHPRICFSAFWPQLRRNQAMNSLSKSCLVESGLQREGDSAAVMRDGDLVFPVRFGSDKLLKEIHMARAFRTFAPSARSLPFAGAVSAAGLAR